MTPMNASARRGNIYRQAPRLTAILLGTVLLTACTSSLQAPTQSLQAADQAIASAEQARVADYSATELDQARVKFAAAQRAVGAKDMALAQRLADEAFVSAQLATARAEEMKAKRVNEEMIDSTETLKLEMDRNTGQQQ